MKNVKKNLFEQIMEWMTESIYRRIDHAFVDGLVEMDYWGFKVDRDHLGD